MSSSSIRTSLWVAGPILFALGLWLLLFTEATWSTIGPGLGLVVVGALVIAAAQRWPANKPMADVGDQPATSIEPSFSSKNKDESVKNESSVIEDAEAKDVRESVTEPDAASVKTSLPPDSISLE